MPEPVCLSCWLNAVRSWVVDYWIQIMCAGGIGERLSGIYLIYKHITYAYKNNIRTGTNNTQEEDAGRKEPTEKRSSKMDSENDLSPQFVSNMTFTQKGKHVMINKARETSCEKISDVLNVKVVYNRWGFYCYISKEILRREWPLLLHFISLTLLSKATYNKCIQPWGYKPRTTRIKKVKFLQESQTTKCHK